MQGRRKVTSEQSKQGIIEGSIHLLMLLIYSYRIKWLCQSGSLLKWQFSQSTELYLIKG